MSFQDDSHILSRLGILESKEESPRKIHHSPQKANSQLPSEKDRFVEVSIDGTADAKSDSDDEPIFDRNSLLSPNRGVKVYRRKHESSFTCVYLVLLLTYLAVGISSPLPWVTLQSRKEIPYTLLLQNSAGLLVGCLTGKLLCQRLNLVCLSFFATAALCGLSWIISEFPEVTDARIISCMLGFVSGNILYAGPAIWLIYWRGYNRKALFLYVVIAIGSSVIVTTRDNSSLNAGSLGLLSPSVILHKRQADAPLPLSDTAFNSTLSPNATSAKPKKPHIVEGIKTVETKSEQNEQMRKAAASNKTQPPPTTVAPVADNNTTAAEISLKSSTVDDSRTTEATLPTTSTSPTTSSPSSTEATTPPSTRAADFLQSSVATPTISTSTDPTPLNPYPTNVRLVTVVTTTIIAFYILASTFCCIPCSVASDLKFLRLFDPSVAGLTVGCRIRLTLVQIISSFMEGLVELTAVALSLQQNTTNTLVFHHIVVVVSRATVMISGPVAYSLTGCCIAMLFSLLGSVLLLISSTDSSVGLTLASAGTGVFGLLVFFYIEICVSPRGGTQLDYFVFPSVVGRCLCTALAAIISVDESQMMGVVLFANAPLLLLFILLVKSLRKAARLKEIMEYSSSPVMEAVGEYVSLIERDIDYDSAEELDDGDGLAG
ncbi:hypothetical protein ANCCAN_00350 [Ancylostoma caninum]|uniref:Uncharacterized protein n=1 Tax=Ancylostoma caninum TaxID=29170 RepID=A0A368HCC5_ANCCA|nr:hypothetical protein ANCCAN_00350 [Ancylostoma caninum]